MGKSNIRKQLPALKVNQWLPGWSAVKWSKKEHRAEPDHWFYQFSISAGHLKALSGVHKRTTRDRITASQDLGIQRRHEQGRSNEIARFVEFGYPWSELSEKQREQGDYSALRKPGWLPTAIVVNVLTANDARRGRKVKPSDLVEVSVGKDGHATVTLPDGFTGRDWQPHELHPIEVIDGQHRLWAFEESSLPDDFELPVVAFKGLDLSWQAYLFYTINIKPKRINASLAFDLYPLLRTEDWLTRFEGHIIYRETRSQELVDLLWAHERSPWHHRINMLGEPGHKGLMVSQAAWIRSLLATFVKSWEGRGARVGGLFGSPVGKALDTPSWSRAEQAAVLIFLGESFKNAIKGAPYAWVKALRSQERPQGLPPTMDLAFYGPNSLLNQDQGIRGFLYIVNDMLYSYADEIGLTEWGGAGANEAEEKEVTTALRSLEKQSKLGKFVDELTGALAAYDWRASEAPGLSADEAKLKSVFRGSGGYRELRLELLRHLEVRKDKFSETAHKIRRAIS
ncbi:MAG: DGQHR domain-containing protein [Dehalococcoidia bacterium]